MPMLDPSYVINNEQRAGDSRGREIIKTTTLSINIIYNYIE
jgi:hypothetical protein